MNFRWLGRVIVSRLAFRFALVYWRAADVLDKIPGFNEGFAEAYDRSVARHPYDEE